MRYLYSQPSSRNRLKGRRRVVWEVYLLFLSGSGVVSLRRRRRLLRCRRRWWGGGILLGLTLWVVRGVCRRDAVVWLGGFNGREMESAVMEFDIDVGTV